MLRVGITGGIGSGKSLVSKILESFPFPVFYSDSVAKDISSSDAEVNNQFIELFGAQVFIDGNLNRPYLSQIIFNNEEARMKVNEIIHPKVRAEFSSFVKKHNAQFVFNEAAILFESDGQHFLDKTLLISAPEELKIQRIMSRDNISEVEVKKRMQLQWSDERKRKLADFEIINDEKRALLEQVESFIDQLISS